MNPNNPRSKRRPISPALMRARGSAAAAALAAVLVCTTHTAPAEAALSSVSPGDRIATPDLCTIGYNTACPPSRFGCPASPVPGFASPGHPCSTRRHSAGTADPPVDSAHQSACDGRDGVGVVAAADPGVSARRR